MTVSVSLSNAATPVNPYCKGRGLAIPLVNKPRQLLEHRRWWEKCGGLSGLQVRMALRDGSSGSMPPWLDLCQDGFDPNHCLAQPFKQEGRLQAHPVRHRHCQQGVGGGL